MEDKGSNRKSNLPSRYVSVGPKSAPHRSYYYAMGLKAAMTQSRSDSGVYTGLTMRHQSRLY